MLSSEQICGNRDKTSIARGERKNKRTEERKEERVENKKEGRIEKNQ